MNKLALSFTLALILMLLTLWLLPSSAYSHAINTEQEPYAPTLSFLRDSSQQLTLQAIKQQYKHFTTTQEQVLSFNRSPDHYWFSFDYTSPEMLTHATLISQLPPNSHVTLWLENMSKPQQAIQPIPALLQPIAAFRLDLAKDQHYRFYIHAHHPRDLMRASFKLYSRQQAATYTKTDTLIFSIFLGGFLIAALYNLLLSCSLRDWTYSNIFIFSLALAVEIALNENVIPWHAALGTIDQFTHPIFGFATLITCLQFAPKFVNNSKLTQQAQWVFKQAVRFCFLCLPIALIHPQGDSICFWIALLVVIPAIITLIYINLTNPKRSYSTLLVLALVSIAWPAHLLAETGFIHHYPFFDYIRYAGSLLAATLVSLVHTSRTRHLEQEAEQAKALNQAKDNFLTTITHELRTPMHSVIGIGELLHKTDLDESQRQTHTKHLLEASQHMLGLIDDILDLAQLEQTKPKLHHNIFSLHHFLHSFRSIFETTALQKQLSLTINITGNSHINVKADKKRLSQIMINLLGNAIKYTEQGTVELYAEVKLIDEQHCQLLIAIRDTGIGIAEKDQQNLFNAFYQVQRGRNRPFRGTGLGLAISYQLVQLMGSELKVESQPQQGSRFFFSLQLPIQVTLPEKKSNKPLDKYCLQGKHLLLVDDDQLNAHIAKSMLEKHGALVNLAFNGQEAIEHSKQQTFDLIFMDISMPEMDGYETTQHLHRLHFPNQAPPIIALTAHTMNQERERCLEAGMNDYLAKPFTIDDITRMSLYWLK